MIHTLNCRGKLISLESPIVMGILNITPDSFSDGGKFNEASKALAQVEKMLEEGATMIDIGGYSSRPGATDISVEEEIERIYGITQKILDKFPEVIISIDTFRASVAEEMLSLGVHIINDISGGKLDDRMMEVVAKWKAPYIMMHMKGTPQTMKSLASYEDVVEEVWQFFIGQINQARDLGINDIIIDPGFGFAKNIRHNYQLLLKLARFQLLDIPILAGLSRKSMLYRLLERPVEEMLAPTSIVNFKALEAGANILRVHDVQEAVSCIRLYQYMQEIRMNETV